MTVNYKLTEGDIVGTSVVSNVDTLPSIQTGTFCRAVDMSTGAFGEAELVYVKYTSTLGGVAGDVVVIDRGLKTCVQASTATVKGDVGILMATVTTTQGTAGCYVWVLVRGVHDGANITTGATVGVAALGATAGRVVTTAAGAVLPGYYIRVTGASNIGTAELNYPNFGGSLS